MSVFTKPGLSHSTSIGGTGICASQIDSGALLIGDGTGFQLGTLTAGAGVSISNGSGSITISAAGTYSLPVASSTVLGGVKIGSNVSIAVDGTISVAGPYTLPIASGSVLGGIKVGTGLSIDGSGILSTTITSPLTTKGDVWGYSTINDRVPVGTNGQVLTADSTQALGIKWATPATGSVTSVAQTVPGELSVAGSPIMTSGTLALSWVTQTTNKVFAAPDGSTGTPSFRLLVAADIPSLDAGKITTGTFTAGQIPSLDASMITTGLLATARGGTGVDSSTASNGQLLIGTGTGLSLATLTAGSNITITNASGAITIASTGGGGGPLTISASTNLTSGDSMVVLVTTGITATLPPANSVPPGREFWIKNGNVTGNTIAAFGTDLIDGSGTFGLSSPYMSATLVSDGLSVWYII